jgi:hypothetical protein
MSASVLNVHLRTGGKPSFSRMNQKHSQQMMDCQYSRGIVSCHCLSLTMNKSGQGFPHLAQNFGNKKKRAFFVPHVHP